MSAANPSDVLPPAGDGGPRSAPPIAGHRLLSNGRSLALVTSTAEVSWWCAPEPDSPPLLWSLLDARGAAARWIGARYASTSGRPAGPSARGVIVVGGARVAYRDGLLDLDGEACLVRLVRSEDGMVSLRHRLAVGGFDAAWGVPDPHGFQLDGGGVGLITRGTSTTDAGWLETTVVAGPDSWVGLCVTTGPADVDLEEAVARLDEAERTAVERLRHARLPRHHPERAADALAVLDACTYVPTRAVVAAATTSLPEAPGGDRQFDYRYCWLRDGALATSVASLLGQGDLARSHIGFLCQVAGDDPQLRTPVVDVRGRPVPEERTVDGIAGWAHSRPVRVGNAAAGQLQYDAWVWSRPSRSTSRPAARSTTPRGPWSAGWPTGSPPMSPSPPPGSGSCASHASSSAGTWAAGSSSTGPSGSPAAGARWPDGGTGSKPGPRPATACCRPSTSRAGSRRPTARTTSPTHRP